MPTRSTERRGVRALLMTGLVALALAAPVRAQDEFFEQFDDFFKEETIEGVSKHAQAPAETPATVTIISRDEIERYGFRTLTDVLNFASLGKFVVDDRRYHLAGSRGLYFFEDFNTKILVMLNGHSLNEPWSNYAGIGRSMLVPLDLVEKIEIVYGPSALLYGGYSLYGIVNVITRNGVSMPGARVRFSAGSWETFDTVVSYGASGFSEDDAGATTEWNLLAAAGYYTTEGQDLDLPRFDVADTGNYEAVDLEGGTIWGGPQSGTDHERAPFAFVHARRGGLSLLARAGHRRRGTPFSPYSALYGSSEQHVRDAKGFVELKWDRSFGPHLTLSLRGFHDRYGYDEQDPYADSYTYQETHPEERGYRFILLADSQDTGGEARLTYGRGTHFLTLGGEFRYRSVDSTSFNEFFDGTPTPDPPVDRQPTGRFGVLYGQWEWRPLDALSLVVGGNWATTDPGGSKAQPRLAVIFKPSRQLSVKGLWGRGFRPPSIFEAAWGDFVQQIDNPDLRAEEIESLESSLIWNPTPRVSIQAYGFRSEPRDLITGVHIESVDDIQGGVVGPGGDPEDLLGLLQYQSSGEVRTRGAGGSVRIRGSVLQGYLNLSYAKAEVAGAEDANLAGSSNWLASGGLSYAKADWTASVTARYVGPQKVAPSFAEHTLYGNGETGDFVEASLRVLYKTFIVYPVTFHLDVRNVFNERGGIAASTVYALPTLPIEGRRILVGAEVRF